jgi:hypothetical protein
MNGKKSLVKASVTHVKQRFATIEIIVVILCVLLGFVGSVVLARINTSPIITSFWLATGVAAVVHGFLGGITNAKFNIWGLKLTGAAAVLVGVAFVTNHFLQTQSRIPAAGMYEWQWSGNGWIGYARVAQDGTARFDPMNRFLLCDGQLVQKPLLKMSGTGSARENAAGTELDVSFPVTFLTYDANCKGTDEPYLSVISGKLKRVISYAGRVTYVNKYTDLNNPGTGDMILVGDYTSR